MQIKEILERLKADNRPFTAAGNTEEEISGFSSIYNYRQGTITWLRHLSTLDALESEAPPFYSCVITKTGAARVSNIKCQIWTNDPKDVFFWIIDTFYGKEKEAGVSPKADVEEGALIGQNVSIGAFSYISSDAVIGDNCRIGSNITIKGKVCIGNNVTIQSGAVIGEDGFAFIKHDKVPSFVKHFGGVTIEDGVSIGAQTCICRGAIDDTLIKEHAKIDNLCHIAHNVIIGRRTIIIAGAVIMGSVHIGDDCWVATSMIRDQRRVGDNCVVGMGSVVVNDIPSGMTVAGNPAKPFERKEKI